ncbi:unnamed protein product [Ectocarpus sp. 12 AP-2014]
MKDFFLLGALILLAVGLFYFFMPPKGINPVYGYRTPASTKNDRNWEVANKWVSRLFLGLSIIMCILLYINQNLKFMDSDDLFISSFLGVIAIIFIAVEVTLWRIGKRE